MRHNAERQNKTRGHFMINYKGKLVTPRELQDILGTGQISFEDYKRAIKAHNNEMASPIAEQPKPKRRSKQHGNTTQSEL